MKEIALCADENDLRLPALFFEKVFLAVGKSFVPSPINEDLHYLATKQDMEVLSNVTVQYLNNPAPEELAKFLHSVGHENVEKLSSSELWKIVHSPKVFKDFPNWIVTQGAIRISNSAVHLYQKRCRENGIIAYPVFRSGDAFSGYWQDGSEPHVQLNINNIQIIDPSKLSWDHIIEMRKDSNFREKLRSFRLLFASEYKDKDPNFVMDSLHQKIADYERACKQHGIDLVTGTLNQMISSKSTIGAAGLVILGALTHDPAINNWSIVAGAALEFAGLAIHVIEKRIEFSRSLAGNSIAYLIDLKKHGLIE